MSAYRELLIWAYLGEVWGQRMLEQVLESKVFLAETQGLRVLLTLETRTRLRLKTLVGHDPETTVAEGDALREAEEYAASVEHLANWLGWMRETEELTSGFLPKYERLAALGSPDALPVLQETLEHEHAVQQYAAQQLLGNNREAVQAVIDHLRKWSRPEA